MKTAYGCAAGWSHEQKTAAGCVAALLFFLSLMSGGAAAWVFSVLPVVGNFRYLFKAIFLAAPLAVVTLACWLGAAGGRDDSCCVDGSEIHDRYCGKERFRSAAVWITVLFVGVGIVNVCDTVTVVGQKFNMRIDGTFAQEKEEALRMTAASGLDGKNYRTVTFIRFPGVNDEHFDQPRNLTKNFATALGVFSLSGYEIATEDERLEAFDAIYSEKDFFAKYANADTMENFYRNLLESPQKVQRQLTDNSVRYLLLDKTELADNQLAQKQKDACFVRDYREDVVAALNRLPGIRVVRVTEFNPHYDLVEIDGVNSLCMDGEKQVVPLTDVNMQTIAFPARTAGEYTLSFAWDRHLEAFLAEQDGSVKPLTVQQTENGNILISTEGRSGDVTLTWRNPVCTAGFVWEGIVSFAFIALLVCLWREKIGELGSCKELT